MMKAQQQRDFLITSVSKAPLDAADRALRSNADKLRLGFYSHRRCGGEWVALCNMCCVNVTWQCVGTLA